MKPSFFFPLGFLALTVPSHAVHLQLSGQFGSRASEAQRRSTAMSGTMTQLSDSQNMVYVTNITLNGEAFAVMIDTGSSDLWVSSNVPNAVSQSFQAGVAYASGSAEGDVMSATLDFAEFSIDSQFFIYAPQGNAAAGADGLIGLGPSSGSNVRAQGNSSAANPPLDRIFTSDTSITPAIAILLERASDPEEPYPGDLAVGEVLSNYQDILNQPQHPVTIAPLQGGQHWQTLLDVNGIIGPDGNPIQITTQVTGAQTSNATVVFDTGFTLPQVPPNVADALYGNIPGAVLANLSNIGEIYVLPCDQEVTATFLFGGVEFPIHPLDLNFDGFGLQINGEAFCVGAFQPYSFDIQEQNEVLFDMILGMAFLRNAYILINFGNMVDAATPSTDTAYIQLLPITNATAASQDFTNVRSGAGGATGQQIADMFSSNSTSPGTHSSSSPSKSPVLFGSIAAVVLGLLLLAFGVFCCYRRRRNRHAMSSNTAWTIDQPNYRPIHEPSPQAAYDMHMAHAAQPGYTPAYVPEYKTAWDPRY